MLDAEYEGQALSFFGRARPTSHPISSAAKSATKTLLDQELVFRASDRPKEYAGSIAETRKHIAPSCNATQRCLFMRVAR
jgi:hypothetical protein